MLSGATLVDWKYKRNSFRGKKKRKRESRREKKKKEQNSKKSEKLELCKLFNITIHV
jgi:hypothetical protein